MFLLNLLRSILHTLFMAVTVVPWALAVLIAAPFLNSTQIYWMCAGWLKLAVNGGTFILGIKNHVIGFENLPVGSTAPAVLLVKHQSTWETFCMPALMPHPLAYVFKKELLYVPFFGWAMGRMDMIHIDRSKRAQAFNRVVEQGQRLLNQGTWVIMFPEGTRIPRGQKGSYKNGGTRLAVETGAPVIPIAVTSAKCWPRKAFIKQPGTVEFSIGKPIPSAGREPDELMREVEAWIEAEMRRLDPDAYPQG
ncbi:lysophospholipid acyltransferase family protein [Hydrogenophaga sp. PBL-H3]|uniref:lysophospholipid acyltransferase family protein n=1 Tax=Hydrogenophaga sp. PBL-H3 TaxID=434010 RepID=UPI00131F6A2F|nr:lysophospholipid acyltransferase family protein [Hydrogenophaga sp. PBL-H3]QHE77914.1 1-acyl-sn-glycerol-3-phosphate acyltransferase [Hydrogenophaga sp. PBL-H3]QHE82338.1 1-acyl-sn-glycerol-3-phosphate acyltransferase [Hydrogenophaga sp. PBL-H3]